MVAWLKRWRQSFLLSLICHMLLLTFFYKTVFMHPVGMHDAVIEHVYLFQSKHNKSNIPPHIQQDIKQRSLVMRPKKETIVHHVMKRIDAQVAMKSPIAAVHRPEQGLTPGIKSLLLEQLHDDMSRHLIYPNSAVSLDLSGIARALGASVVIPVSRSAEVSSLYNSRQAVIRQEARRERANQNLADNVSANLAPRLESSGGRPTVPEWTISRVTGYSQNTWEQLQEVAKLASTEDRKVSPAQIASYLIEKSLKEYEP